MRECAGPAGEVPGTTAMAGFDGVELPPTTTRSGLTPTFLGLLVFLLLHDRPAERGVQVLGNAVVRNSLTASAPSASVLGRRASLPAS